MYKRILLSLLFFFTFSSLLISQEKRDWRINFGGYVNFDAFYDTRENVIAREGHLYLYPSNIDNDANGDDINAKPNFNMLAIQTRLSGKITGPNAFGAKTSGVIEGEFFGHTNPDVNGFRLRHAFVKLDWEKTAMLLGQYWNPMFRTEAYPLQLGSNTGIPFQPFARNPQIRLIQDLTDKFSVTAALLAQRDFASAGPQGSSSSYLINSGTPEMHLQFEYDFGKHVIGFGGQYKTLKPREESESGFKSDEMVEGYALMTYLKFNLGDLKLQAKGVYGANLSDLVMIGGYAANSLDANMVESYVPIQVMSAWADLSYGGKVEFGLFTGYSQNLGAGEDVLTDRIYARSPNIDNVYRVSPRIAFNSGKLKLAAEFEYTVAAYGAVTQQAEVENTTNVENLRILFATFYYF